MNLDSQHSYQVGLLLEGGPFQIPLPQGLQVLPEGLDVSWAESLCLNLCLEACNLLFRLLYGALVLSFPSPALLREESSIAGKRPAQNPHEATSALKAGLPQGHNADKVI